MVEYCIDHFFCGKNIVKITVLIKSNVIATKLLIKFLAFIEMKV